MAKEWLIGMSRFEQTSLSSYLLDRANEVSMCMYKKNRCQNSGRLQGHYIACGSFGGLKLLGVSSPRD